MILDTGKKIIIFKPSVHITMGISVEVNDNMVDMVLKRPLLRQYVAHIGLQNYLIENVTQFICGMQHAAGRMRQNEAKKTI